MNSIDLNLLTNYFKYLPVKENIFIIKDRNIIIEILKKFHNYMI